MYISRVYIEIQSFADRKGMKKFHDALKTIYGPKSSGATTLLSADGRTLLTDKEVTLKRWAEHFNSVLNRPSSINDDAIDILPQIECNVLLDEFPTVIETRKAVQHLSSDQAPGTDAIPAEVYKAGGLPMAEKVTELYSQNTNLLPPKPKSSFRHLKQGIQEFHRKYVLVPADKAANNVVVVCRLHYVNTLKQELDGTRAYLETDTDEVSVVNAHLNDLPVKFSVCVNEGQDKLPTMYWLPKLHKRPYKARFIANSSSCTTTELSKLLTSCLTAIKSHVIRYCETVYETSNKNWFWSIKNSGEVLSKLKCRGFRATSLSTYDFSTLYTTLPHNLIKEKLLDLIEWTFKRALKNYGSLYLACNDRKAFFTSSDQSRYTLWSCQNVCDALSYLLDNIYIRFGTKLYRQIVGIPMGTNCAPLVADLFLYCYERDFMDSLNHDNQADVIEAFNSTSRYLDDLLNIDNPYFEGMVNQIYPP